MAKEFFSSSALYQQFVARFLLDREQSALERLSSVPGVPEVGGRPHPACLLLEYRSGKPLAEVPPGDLPLGALEGAERLLDQIHRKGVIHGDIGHDFNGRLGRETNFLWCPERGWTLLDFGGSLCGRGRFPWEHQLRKIMKAHDLLFLTKLILTHFPTLEEHPYLVYPVRVDYSTWNWWKRLGKL